MEKEVQIKCNYSIELAFLPSSKLGIWLFLQFVKIHNIVRLGEAIPTFCVAEDLHSTMFSSEEVIADHCQDCKDSSGPWSGHQPRQGWNLNIAVGFIPKLPGGDWDSSWTCGSALVLLIALLPAGGWAQWQPLDLCFVAVHRGHSEVQWNAKPSRQSAKPERIITSSGHKDVLRCGTWAHVPVQTLGFVCFHHVRLEVKRCNDPLIHLKRYPSSWKYL